MDILPIFLVFFHFVFIVQGQDGCKVPAVINASAGRIESPYYSYFPNFTYTANAKCRWTIKVPDGKNIKLSFRDRFELQTSPSCINYDYVTFFPVDEIAGSNFGICTYKASQWTFCGHPRNPFPPVVIGNDEVIVEFCTNSFSQYQGFRLDFESTTSPPSPPVTTTTEKPRFICPELKLNVTSETRELLIESPRFPGPYPAPTYCIWEIDMNTVPGKSLYINAEAFDIVMDPNNYYEADEMGISEYTASDDYRDFRFHGKHGPTGLRVGGIVTFRFLTKAQPTTAQGFRLRVKVSDCDVKDGFCIGSPKQDVCFKEEMMCNGNLDCPEALDEQCPSGCGNPASSPWLSNKDTRILGGIDARPHSWPWQVGFVAFHTHLLCVGSIIGHSWIMTSATCCDILQQYWPLDALVSAVVGEHDLSQSREPSVAMYYVDRLERFPTGDSDLRPDDFCLVKTKSKMFFNDHVMPVCLPSVIDPPINTTCYLTGWGLSEQPQTNIYGTALLKQADLKIAAPNKCMGVDNVEIPGMRRSIICAENGHKESCFMDDGAPLVCRNNGRWELVGISNARLPSSCSITDPYPQQFAKVSFALDWIGSVMFGQ